MAERKLLAWGKDFVIRDDAGRDCYRVDGRVLSFGDKLSLQTMDGQEVAFVAQRLLSGGWTYEIHRGGKPFAVVKEKLFTLFHFQFTVDVPELDDYHATGDPFSHEHTFQRSAGPVAHVSKRWFTIADTYGIDVADGEDDVTILAAVAVIDLCTHGHRDQQSFMLSGTT